MEDYFNDPLKVCVPKSSDNDDADPRIVTPEKTRPLGLKNTDNKAISGVTNFSIRGVLAANLDSSQRGFLHKRFLLKTLLK